MATYYDKMSKANLLKIANSAGVTTKYSDGKTMSKDDLADHLHQLDISGAIGSDKKMYAGGLATKNYVNPVTIVDNRKKKK